MAQPGKRAAHGGEQQRRAVTVLDVGAMHDRGDEQSHRIDQQMALVAVDLLASVKAMGTGRLRRLRRLAVDDPGRGARLAPFHLAGRITSA